MAEVQTDFYPKVDQRTLLDVYGQAAQVGNALIANKRQQVALDQDKANYVFEQYGRMSQFLGSLAQDPRVGTEEGPALIQGAARQAVEQGWLTPEMAQSEMKNLPGDFRQIPQWLQNMNVRVQDAAGQFAKIYGEPQFIPTGNQLVPATVSPITPMRQIGAPIQLETSPSERATLVETTDQSGRTIVRPKGFILEESGVNPLTAMPQSVPSGPGNRLMPPGAPAAVPGGVVTSPPAGEIEAQRALGAAGGQLLAEDAARERNFQAEMVPLTKAKDALVALGPTGSGPGQEQLQEIQSFLTSMGMLAPTEGLKNFDEARKYLVQFASQAASPGTNDRLAAAFAGNPSVNISNAAAVDVVKTAMAVRRLQNAQVRAFEASGEPPSSYNQWATQFNAAQDPVAYGADMMSDADRKKYFAGLNDADRQRFLDSLRVATSLGLVSPPR